MRVERFFSPALGVEKHYVVYLPPSYATAPTRRYPVAYYLHGLTGNEADWVALASIDVVADSLIAGGGPEMIVVMPDGDDGWYTNWEEAPQPYGVCLVDTLLNRAAPALCVVEARYEDYIARDLVRHVDSTYRTLADRRHRGIAGLSMGDSGPSRSRSGIPTYSRRPRVIRACCRRSTPGRIPRLEVLARACGREPALACRPHRALRGETLPLHGQATAPGRAVRPGVARGSSSRSAPAPPGPPPRPPSRQC